LCFIYNRKMFYKNLRCASVRQMSPSTFYSTFIYIPSVSGETWKKTGFRTLTMRVSGAL
jgi:hypothetical protein